MAKLYGQLSELSLEAEGRKTHVQADLMGGVREARRRTGSPVESSTATIWVAATMGTEKGLNPTHATPLQVGHAVMLSSTAAGTR